MIILRTNKTGRSRKKNEWNEKIQMCPSLARTGHPEREVVWNRKFSSRNWNERACTKKIFFNNCSFVDKQKHVLRSEPCWRNVGPFLSNLVGGKLIGGIALKANFVIYLGSCVWLFVIFSGELHLRNLYCYLSEESSLEASSAMKEEPCWRLVVWFKKGNMLWRKVLQFLEFSWRKVLSYTLKHG